MVTDAFRSRFARLWVGALRKGGFYSASGYLRTGQGASAANILILASWAAALSTCDALWCLAADFSMTPQKLTNTGWLSKVDGIGIATILPTCNERVIDLFVVSKLFARHVVGIVRIDGSAIKTHCPVRLLLSPRVWRHYERTLTRPPKIAVNLPRIALPDMWSGAVRAIEQLMEADLHAGAELAEWAETLIQDTWTRI